MEATTKTDPESGQSGELSLPDAIAFFAAFYRGEHHIPARGYYGKHGVRQDARGAFSVRHLGGLSSFDYDDLTRLVVLAHDFCVRVDVTPASPRYLRIRITGRTRDGGFTMRHPTLEEAAAEQRSARTDAFSESVCDFTAITAARGAAMRAPRPWDLRPELYECESCASQPGSPLLCDRCLKARRKAGTRWQGCRPATTTT